MKKNLLRFLTALLFIGALTLLPSIDGQAKTNIKSGTVKLDSEYYYEDYGYDEDEDSNKKHQINIPIKTNKKMLLIISLDVKILDDYYNKGGIRVQLRNEQGKLFQNDYLSLKGVDESEEYNWWFYTDQIFVPSGKYQYTLINKSGLDVKVKYKVTGYQKLSSSVKLNKTVNIKSGADKKIKLTPKPAGSFPMIKDISDSKGLISDWWQRADGSLYIEGGKKPKEGTLTIKLKSGKKYKVKIKVTPGDPDFSAYLTDYYTRNNYFTAKIKNYGTSNLTIIRQGKVINVDYKSFDRKLKSMKSVTIRPGQTKTVKFYLKGSTTWYDVADYTLYAKIKYQGKTYEWHVWDEDSVYKVGKYWYDTCTDDE